MWLIGLVAWWLWGEGQWRRQTIKLGSAIKGQLYIRVGQMEGPNIPSEAQEVQSAGEPKGCDRVGVAPWGPGSYAQENFSKINFEMAYFLQFCKLK